MNTSENRLAVTLAPRAMFSVPDAAGVQFTCHAGSVWITLDGDPRDIVLDSGEDFSSAEHRRALIYALAPSQVGVTTAAAQHPRPGHAPATVAPRGLVFEQVLA